MYSYIREEFSKSDTNTNVLTGLMISLYLAASAPKVQRAWNLMGKSVWNRPTFFLLLGKKYFFIENSSFLINNFFGNVFSNFEELQA